MGVGEATFYRWKKKYAGMGVAKIRRLKQLVADLSLDKAMLQDALRKKCLTPVRRRKLVAHILRRATRSPSSGHAERLLCPVQSSVQERSGQAGGVTDSVAGPGATARPSYGYQRLHVLLLREGWRVNHKRVYRLYTEEGLSMRRKPPKRRTMAARRKKLPRPTKTNESRSMDFMSDQLYCGRRIRVLTIVDNHSRESLALKVGRSFKGEDVVAVLNELIQVRGTPRSIRVDNGTEFTSKVVDPWAYWSRVTGSHAIARSPEFPSRHLRQQRP